MEYVMAVCPYCHEYKFMFAPVCNNCNNEIPLLTQLGASFFMTILPPIFLVGFFWGAYELILLLPDPG